MVDAWFELHDWFGKLPDAWFESTSTQGSYRAILQVLQPLGG